MAGLCKPVRTLVNAVRFLSSSTTVLGTSLLPNKRLTPVASSGPKACPIPLQQSASALWSRGRRRRKRRRLTSCNGSLQNLYQFPSATVDHLPTTEPFPFSTRSVKGLKAALISSSDTAFEQLVKG